MNVIPLNPFLESGLKARDYLDGPVAGLVDAHHTYASHGAHADESTVPSAIHAATHAVADVLLAALQIDPKRNWLRLIDLTSAEVLMLLVRRYMHHGYSPSDSADETEVLTVATVNGALELTELAFRVRWDVNDGLVIVDISAQS